MRIGNHICVIIGVTLIFISLLSWGQEVKSDPHPSSAVIFEPIKTNATFQDLYLIPPSFNSKIEPERKSWSHHRSISSNCDFGSIPYTEGITPSGGKTYSIPIATSAVSKFAPSIALLYNSQSGEGLAGYGWSVQGLATITLSGKTQYYNGSIAAPNVTDNNPVFALDGVPIVQSTNPSLQSSFPYTTARGNIQVKKHTTSSGAVSHFTVLYPDGSRATFGCDTTSVTKASYPITQIEDIHGNKIVIDYSISGGLYLPSTIKYDYSGAFSPQGKITFSYSSRSPCTTYTAGESHTNDKILTGISSYSENNQLLAYYQLEHIYRHGTHLLSSLTVHNQDEELSPLVFSYADTVASKDFIQQYGGPVSNNYNWNGKLRHLRGKFVKGEYSDGLISLPDLKSYAQIGTLTQISPLGIVLATYYYYGSEYTSNHSILIAPHLSNNYNTFVVSAGIGMQALEAADVDGDGADEIIKVNYTNISADSTTYRIKIYKYNDIYDQLDSSSFDVNLKGAVDHGGCLSPAGRTFYFGRFGNSSHLQLLTVSHDQDFIGRSCDSYCTLIDLVDHTLYTSQSLSVSPGDEYKYLVYDMDGDGKTDVCVGNANGNGYQHYACNSNGSFVPDRVITGMDPGILTGIHYIADMNGDGYPDIVRDPGIGYYETIDDETHYVSGGNEWGIYSFTGNEFVRRTCYAATHEPNDSFVLIDLNSDGLTDLIKVSGQSISIYPNENGVISDNSVIVSSQTLPQGSELVPVNKVVSGVASHCIAIKNNYVFGYSFSEDRSLNRLLNIFEDSFGNVQENWYKKGTNPAVYHKDTSLTYSLPQGFYTLAIPIPLLDTTKLFAGGTDLVAKTEYEYYNSVLNNKGLGFCGFGKVQVKDYVSGNLTTTINDPQKFGVPLSSTISKGDTIPPYSTVTNTYDSNTTTYGKLNPRLTQSVAADSLTGVVTTTSYTYGSYDLPTTIVTSKRIGNGDEQTQTISRVYSSCVTPIKYILGAVSSESVIVESDGVSPFSWEERTINTLDSYYRPINTKKYVGKNGIDEPPGHLIPDPFYQLTYEASNLVSTTRLTYDAHGNVTSEKTAPYGATTFTGDTLVYDANGRYLLSKTDALGHTTTYSNYNKFGQPTTVTDYRNRSTTYTYDSWGNLIQVSYPDGGVEQTTAAWGGDGLYTITQTATGSPETITHYDALGREIKSGVKRFNGQWQFTNKEYDSKGRLSRVSLPYRGSAPSYWNTYHYDVYDRPDSLCEASGRKTYWSYNGTSTTTIKDGISITRTTDAMGRVVSTSDGGGTVTYTLRDDGQPSSITAPGNVVTSFTYDSYGRRTQMVDPSLGTESDSYTWNADGSSVFTHTNRNGSVTTDRDRYGRVTAVSRQGEFNTTYTYDTYGRLSAVSSTNGTGKEYTYDSYDRVATFKETVPNNKWLQKTYAYSTGSVLSSIAYTSQNGSITTETYTYSNGHNTGINIPGNITVWSLVSENDLGQPTSIQTGGITRTYGYTAFGLPTYRNMDGGYIQSFSYQFDSSTGNLLSRGGYILNATESFTYDNLNRLTAITIGNTTRQIVYQDNGNITSIDGVGTLIYGGGAGVSPYEVTGLTPETGQPAYRQRSVTYNSFDRPSYVLENNDEYPTAWFIYNADGERVFADIEYLDGFLHWQHYIGGRYEHDDFYGFITERLYLGGDAYSAPMVLQKAPGGNWTLYNIGRDYLGSITSISDANGNIIALYRYDPWGRMVDPMTGAPYSPGNEPTLFLGRGFTSHEHLTKLGLIYANARLYDPLLGRFLSPDPYVQDPDFTQNYNRYSYCLNNPLKYTAESGAVLISALLISMGIGTIVNLAFNWGNIDNFGEGLLVGLMGAGAGAITIMSGGASIGLQLAMSAGLGFANAATNNAVKQLGASGTGSFDSSYFWRSSISGAFTGAISVGASKLINSGWVSTVLDKTGITNNFARNVVGNTIEGVASGIITGAANGVGSQFAQKGFKNWDWSTIGNSALYGSLISGGVGAINGVVQEAVYQANRYYGHTNLANSDVADAIGIGSEDILSNLESSELSGIWPLGHNYANDVYELAGSITIGITTGRCTITIDPSAPMVPTYPTYYAPKP